LFKTLCIRAKNWKPWNKYAEFVAFKTDDQLVFLAMSIAKKTTVAKPGPVAQNCELLDKIFLFPEEIEELQKLADSKKVPFELDLEDIILDKKHKEILVLRYTLIKSKDSLCPFYDRKKKVCGIKDKQPVHCKPLPLIFNAVENQETEIGILGPLSAKYKALDPDDLENDFPDLYNLLRDAYSRHEDGLAFVKKLSSCGEIDIAQNITFDEFEKIITTWAPVGLIPDPPEPTAPVKGGDVPDPDTGDGEDEDASDDDDE
jgi:Fe-S-cluster containining protein